MVFSSASFLFMFLPVVLALYYCGGKRFRNMTLLVASLVFYAWGEPVYVLLMIASIIFNWAMALLMSRMPTRGQQKIVLSLAVVANLAVLGYYKYAGFAIATLLELAPASAGQLSTWTAPLLPIGISFFTFHAISYLVDIYRREATALVNPLDMGLYISLFPQLVAGPIIRYHDVADQITHRTNNIVRFASGVERFVFGLAKKILIANPLGEIADGVFGMPQDELSMAAAWVGIICYTLQIYFDFSGYSDMAIGLGRMLGFEFLENFNYPYVAKSVREFWRRWHLSLSAWFRDYLYIPLGGNRSGPILSRLNLLIVFLLCGLWHGASWAFAIWGLWHGLFLVLERGAWGRLTEQAPRFLQHAYTLAVVMVGWVFFRSETLSDAGHYLSVLIGMGPDAASTALMVQFTPRVQATLVAGLLLSTPMFAGLASDVQSRRFPITAGNAHAITPAAAEGRLPAGVLSSARIVIIVGLMVFIGAYVAAGTYNPFIYFRF